MESEADRQFSTDDVRRILERATKLEKLDGASISESELRAIAAEAQIDPRAITRAIAEDSSDYPPAPANAVVSSPSRYRLFASAGGTGLLTGLVMAVLADGMVINKPDLFGLGLIAIGVFRAGLTARGEGWHREFQVKNVLLWGGYAAGWAIVRTSVGLPALLVCSICAAVSAAVGAGINTSGSTPRGLLRRVASFIASRGSAPPPKGADHDEMRFRTVPSIPLG